MKITAKWKQKRRCHWLNIYKIRKGCTSCGYNNHPQSLCFDHIDPATKNPITKNNYGQRKDTGAGMYQLTAPKFPIKMLMEEVRKCQVMCHNCHMEQRYYKVKVENGIIRYLNT